MRISEALSADPRAVEGLPRLTPLLLRWYRDNARDLPWRRDPTPYRVWVSEIILQQTRVEAVRERYIQFLGALPDVSSLAEAPQDVLLKLWEGMGYYSRVRNLQKAARILCRDYGGELPADYEALRKLPGLGEYTAGAVASIAFGLPCPAADGNVYRVLSRILCSRADITQTAVKKAFRECAVSMLPGDCPGDFNQALMDLGATVCLPNREPLCGECPVGEQCLARREGCAAALPVKAAKKPRRVEERTVLIILGRGEVLLRQIEEGGLLAGLYAPPHPLGCLDRDEARCAVEDMGGDCREVLPLREAKHLFTHVEWRMRGYLVRCEPFEAPGVWADAEALTGRYAVPSAFRAFTRELPGWLTGEK